jgi:hypothetical protein
MSEEKTEKRDGGRKKRRTKQAGGCALPVARTPNQSKTKGILAQVEIDRRA